jgi:predicted ABC-type transport system involved in lysophospholipase L1 biosynthesis ATPase subunit
VSPPALEIVALTKDYHGLRPLRIQRLTLAAGDQVALLGFDEPAAEMMTTLITGAALPDQGTIGVLGTSTAAIEDSAAWLKLVDRIGIVSERAVLLSPLSVIQNLSIPFTLEIEPPPAATQERAAALAREVGLPEDAWHGPVGALDATSRLRVRLARALSFDPALLLLEHPTARVTRTDVKPLAVSVRSIAERRGLAALTLSADAEFAAAVARRVATWEPASGRLIEQSPGGWFRRRSR